MSGAAGAPQGGRVRVMLVEDSLVGIQAAKAAGMVALLYSPSPPNHPYGADVTFADMKELTTIISSFEG